MSFPTSGNFLSILALKWMHALLIYVGKESDFDLKRKSDEPGRSSIEMNFSDYPERLVQYLDLKWQLVIFPLLPPPFPK